MKINRVTKTDFELTEDEIDLFMKAMTRAGIISEWGEAHRAELSASARTLDTEAATVRQALYNFLTWMCVDVDELQWRYDDADEGQEKAEL